MSDITIYTRDVKTSDLKPIKGIDNGDGTFTAGALPLFASQEVYYKTFRKVSLFRRLLKWLIR